MFLVAVIVGSIIMSLFGRYPFAGPIIAGIVCTFIMSDQKKGMLAAFISGSFTGIFAGRLPRYFSNSENEFSSKQFLIPDALPIACKKIVLPIPSRDTLVTVISVVAVCPEIRPVQASSRLPLTRDASGGNVQRNLSSPSRFRFKVTSAFK